MRRLTLLLLLVLAPVALAGCGNKSDEPVLLAETEGIYIEVSDLKYQVQISRQLNPQDTEDQQFIKGRTIGEEPTSKETYFGVFLLVQNLTEESHEIASRFEIEDTLGKIYTPELIDPKVNPFVYKSTTLAPGATYPARESPSGEGPIGGGMLLFKLPLDAFYNRPLEFKIHSPDDENVVGTVDLDV
jgi:hypothetical protein